MFAEEYYSPLAPAELLGRLQNNLNPAFSWAELLTSVPKKQFRGNIEAGSFLIQRIVSYKNPMLPQLAGYVVPHPDVGTLLIIKYHPPVVIVLFAVIWLGAVGIFTLNAVIESLRFNAYTSELMPALILLVSGLAFFTIPFWLEMRRVRVMLIHLLLLQAMPNV